MATSGWFNHYDDPDEFWDEEPLVSRPTNTHTHTHTHRPHLQSVRMTLVSAARAVAQISLAPVRP